MFVYPRLQKNNCGFTLIELLTSIVIFSFLSGVIYVSLAQGLRIWKAAVGQTQDWKQDLFIENFKSELQNAFIRQGPALKGAPGAIQFYSMLPDVRRPQKIDGSNRLPAQVTYRYDSSQKAIMKETAFYEKILYPDSKEDTLKQEAIDHVNGLRFEYFHHPKDKVIAASWQSRWNDVCLPEAVKMTLELKNVRTVKKVYILNLPSRGVCPETRRA